MIATKNFLSNKKRFKCDYYFKVANHQELFKLGQRYTQDFLEGKKSFALTSISSCTTTEESMLGLSSYFNYHHELKATLIVNSIEETKILKSMPVLHREIRCFDASQIENEGKFEFFAMQICILPDGQNVIETNFYKSGSPTLHLWKNWLRVLKIDLNLCFVYVRE